MQSYKFMQAMAMSAILLTGCASVEMVDTKNDRGTAVAGLDYRDFDKATNDAIASLLSSPSIQHPGGGRYVLIISRIKNDTMQRIDTDQLVKKIRIALLNSGKVVTTTAMADNGPEDKASYAVREGVRGNEEFDQSRVQTTGGLQAPELSLSGKILQRNVRMPNGGTQIEYYFQLSLTHLQSGLAMWEWENQDPIIKRSSSKAVSW